MITERQAQVLVLIADGLSTKEIAHALHIGVRTVEVHRRMAAQRLGARNAFHAAVVWDRAHRVPYAEELLAAQAAQIDGLQTTMRNIKPYLEWTISDESPGCHPTMPSAVGAFLEALASEPKP